IVHKRARPYHPQTCGKIERFHQAMKRYLAKQSPARTIAQLQRQLDAFLRTYNEQRPHRALGRLTPAEVFDAKCKAAPEATVATHFRIRRDRVAASSRCATTRGCCTSGLALGTKASASCCWWRTAMCASP